LVWLVNLVGFFPRKGKPWSGVGELAPFYLSKRSSGAAPLAFLGPPKKKPRFGRRCLRQIFPLFSSEAACSCRLTKSIGHSSKNFRKYPSKIFDSNLMKMLSFLQWPSCLFPVQAFSVSFKINSKKAFDIPKVLSLLTD